MRLRIVDCGLGIEGAGHRSRHSAFHDSGFTLIELIIVLGILSIMVTAVFPIIRNVERRQKEQELRESLRMIRLGIDRYKKFCEAGGIPTLERKQDDMCYPLTLEILVEGVTPPNSINKVRFLPRIPKDPLTGSADWGLRSAQDEKDTTSWGGQNVFDVYSKSTGVALDGRKYGDW
ncbi:MAG TPA: type II secretion system protein [Blastocatellia bacterium]|nr:type II secretion system protein [Blastocatellia bacterium]